ncbi:MAG: helix-turn-helix transcriptional regulator [Bacteroidota bacterium]
MSQHSLGEFQELVLLCVAVLHGEAYGVAILKKLQTETGKKFNVSAVHVALKRMEEKGFVKSAYGGITNERGGRRKKFYLVTALGKRILDEQYELRTRMYQGIPNISFN